MVAIGLFEAKTKLSALVRRAEAGETFVITVHGRPVAELGPSAAARRRLTPQEAVDGLRAFRRTHHLGDVKIRELIEAGRDR